MKKIALFLTVLLSSAVAQAADYFLPYTECDGSANVRSAPDTRSKIMTVLDYESKKHKILSKQGKWFHIQLDGHRTGYVHQSQGFIVHNYVVASPDGSANVRNNSYPRRTDQARRNHQNTPKRNTCTDRPSLQKRRLVVVQQSGSLHRKRRVWSSCFDSGLYPQKSTSTRGVINKQFIR